MKSPKSFLLGLRLRRLPLPPSAAVVEVVEVGEVAEVVEVAGVSPDVIVEARGSLGASMKRT